MDFAGLAAPRARRVGGMRFEVHDSSGVVADLSTEQSATLEAQARHRRSGGEIHYWVVQVKMTKLWDSHKAYKRGNPYK